MARSIPVFVSGIDGSGKSTIAEDLAAMLRGSNLPVVTRWFRFPYFLTLPLLALSRLTGRTRVYEAGGKRFTVHFFEDFPFVYKLLFTFDHALYYLLKYKIPGLLPVIIVSDRGPLDNLVDLLSDTGDYRADSLLTRLFLKMQARGITIFATARREDLLSRRPEAKVDPKYDARLSLYETLLSAHRDILKPIIINTSRNYEANRAIVKTIARTISLHYGHVGWGKNLRNTYLRALAASKAFLLANWLFQGVRIADVSENAFRLILDLSAILAGAASGSIIILLLLFIISHTLAYLLASNSPIAFSYLEISKPPEEALRLLKEYASTHEPGEYIDKIIVFGSISRAESKRYSDIDVRIIRRAGVRNALRALLWTMKLRLYAWRKRLPLDVFIAREESVKEIVRGEERKNLLIIYQRGGK